MTGDECLAPVPGEKRLPSLSDAGPKVLVRLARQEACARSFRSVEGALDGHPHFIFCLELFEIPRFRFAEALYRAKLDRPWSCGECRGLPRSLHPGVDGKVDRYLAQQGTERFGLGHAGRVERRIIAPEILSRLEVRHGAVPRQIDSASLGHGRAA